MSDAAAAAAVRRRVAELLAADHLGARTQLLAALDSGGGPFRGVVLLRVADALGGADTEVALDCAAAMELAGLAAHCLRSVEDEPATAEQTAVNLLSAWLSANLPISSFSTCACPI